LHEGAWRPWDRSSFALPGLLETCALGIPIGLQMSLEAWAFTLASFMAGWIDVSTVAAHQIVLNMAALAFMVPLGVSMAAATRVGNLIGQGDVETMRRAVKASLVLGAGAMGFSAIAFSALREQLPRLYTDDGRLIELAAMILPLAAAFQLADGVQVVAGGVLRGMGRPNAAAVINLVGYYAFALPVAYVLAFSLGLGLYGIWLALVLGLLVVAASLAGWALKTARRPLSELQLVRVTPRVLTPPAGPEPVSTS
jgi:MATE family multidrug resistance protein